MERYTLWKRVWECVASGSSGRFLRARFSQIGSGKNGARVNLGTAFSIRFPGKTRVFSTIIRLSSGRPDSPTFSRVFVIYSSRPKIHRIEFRIEILFEFNYFDRLFLTNLRQQYICV